MFIHIHRHCSQRNMCVCACVKRRKDKFFLKLISCNGCIMKSYCFYTYLNRHQTACNVLLSRQKEVEISRRRGFLAKMGYSNTLAKSQVKSSFDVCNWICPWLFSVSLRVQRARASRRMCVCQEAICVCRLADENDDGSRSLNLYVDSYFVVLRKMYEFKMKTMSCNIALAMY